MSALHRSAVGLLGLIIPLAALAADEPPKGPFDEPAPRPAFQVPTNFRFGPRLKAARDNVFAERWPNACEALQSVLNAKEDRFAEVERKGPDGKTIKAVVSARREADRILAEMPAVGREIY